MAGIIEAFEHKQDCGGATSEVDTASDKVSTSTDGTIAEGQRNSTVFNKSVGYFKMGLPDNDVLVLVQNFNKRECKPPLSENEVTQTVKSASRYKTTVAGHTVFPPIVKAITDPEELPPLQPELIQGVLRKGAYMALVGASKMGKSFLLIDLAVCIQNGLKWLNFQCKKGRVLYVNLEIEENSFMKRVSTVYQKYEGFKDFEKFDILNLRGYGVGIEQLEQELDTLDGYDLFIIDPQYKVNAGDENSASEQGAFFNHIDHIATTHKTSVVICHHHSKGSKLKDSAIDRACGSGVLGRSVDALLDIVGVKDCIPPDDYFKPKALVLTAILRDFPDIEPIGLWWDFPHHHIDESGEILQQYAKQSGEKTTDLKKGMYQEIIEGLIRKEGYATLKTFKVASKLSHNTCKKWIPLCGYELSNETRDNSPLIVKVSK